MSMQIPNRRLAASVPLAGVGALHFPPKTARVVDRLILNSCPA